MVKKVVLVCDSCGATMLDPAGQFNAVFREVPDAQFNPQEITKGKAARVHLWATGGSPDPSGGTDRDVVIDLDLCVRCARRLVEAVEKIANSQGPA